MIDYRSSSFRRYFSNASWLMAERMSRILISFFVGILVARYLGPERFGLLSYALSFVALFSCFESLGLEDVLIRDFVEKQTSKETLLGTGFVLRALGSILLVLLVYLVLHLTHADNFTILITMVIASGCLFQPASVIGTYFQSQVQARFLSVAQFFSLVLSSGTRLAFIFFQATLLWFACAVVLENALFAAALFWLYYRHSSSLRSWSFNKLAARSLLQNSWPLILASMAIMVYMRIDQVMLKALLNDEAVGHYAAAVRFSEAFYFIPIAVCASLFPAIIQSKKGGKEVYHLRIQNLSDLMLILALVIALPVTFLADPIILHLLGPAFSPAAGVLKIHIWAGVFVFLGVASGKWLLAENLQHYSFYSTLAGAIVNVLLNFILIPQMGIQGAAVATVISQCISAYLSLAFFKKTREGFWILTRAFNPFAAQKRLFHA